VFLYLVDVNGKTSESFVLLQEDEITVNGDAALAGFEKRLFPLSSYQEYLDEVVKIVVFIPGVEEDFDFWIEDIKLRKSQKFYSQASARYRYGNAETVTFASLLVDGLEPQGTAIRGRIRVAGTEAELDSALFSPFFDGNTAFNTRGKWAEIEVILSSDPSNEFAPTVKLIELGLLVDSEETGIYVDSLDSFSKGTRNNIDYHGDVELKISTPVTVKNISAISTDNVVEFDPDKNPVFGFSGANLPISESQALDRILGLDSPRGLKNPKRLVRTPNKKFVVSDTENHRVVIFSPDGSVDRIYAGKNDDFEFDLPEFKPLTATVNTEDNVMYLGFSKSISVRAAAFTEVVVTVGGLAFDLLEDATLAYGTAPINDRVIAIPLTDQHAALLSSNQETARVKYNEEFSASIDKLFTGASTEISVDFAPITYHKWIYFPVHAEPTFGENLLICNATRLPFFLNDDGNEVEPEPADTYNIQHFDPNQEEPVSFSNFMDFTVEYGGCIHRAADGTVWVSGVNRQRQGAVGYMDNIDGDGSTRIYASPLGNFPTGVSTDSVGRAWISESSVVERGGRAIRIDRDGNITAKINEVFTNINSIQVIDDDNLLVSC
jgi:hypothetical protein